MKKIVIALVFLIAILFVAIIGRSLILDKSSPVSLKVDPIAWAIQKSLQNSSSGQYQPIEGKDYTITKVKYFNNNQWAVAYTAPVGTFSDSGTIVFEKNVGIYQAVLGPSNSFQGSNLGNLPPDVANYLNPSASGGTSQ